VGYNGFESAAQRLSPTLRSTGRIAASRRLAKHFIFGKSASRRNAPLSSNVRPQIMSSRISRPFLNRVGATEAFQILGGLGGSFSWFIVCTNLAAEKAFTSGEQLTILLSVLCCLLPFATSRKFRTILQAFAIGPALGSCFLGTVWTLAAIEQQSPSIRNWAIAQVTVTVVLLLVLHRTREVRIHE